MAGLLGFLAAGAVKGAGDGIVAEARAKREAAIAELANSRLESREAADRDFRSKEGQLDRNARSSEAATAREFTAKEGALDRGAVSAKAQATPPEVKEFFDDQGQAYKAQWDPAAKEWVKIGGSKATSNSGGVTISPDGTVEIGGSGAKIPSGFMPDPATPGAIKPIPGGPGEQISSELAARVGLADKFLERAPALRERLAAGEVSGPIDVTQARNNQSSPQAEVQRELEFGVEALVRMLTGAGMNAAESEEKARRYMPTYTDDAKSMTKKLDDLTDYLASTKEMAMRGRGGRVGGNDAPSGGNAEKDTAKPASSLRDKYGLE